LCVGELLTSARGFATRDKPLRSGVDKTTRRAPAPTLLPHSLAFSMTAFQTTRRTLLQLIGSLPVFRAVQDRAASSFTLVPAFAPGQVMQYSPPEVDLIGG